jgi:hypothetical protein
MRSLTKLMIDGRHRAVAVEHFPAGSTSYLFPHYAIRYLGSPDRVVVASSRVTRADDAGVELDPEGFPRGIGPRQIAEVR